MVVKKNRFTKCLEQMNIDKYTLTLINAQYIIYNILMKYFWDFIISPHR